MPSTLYNLSPEPEDALSAIQFSSTSYKLLAAAWDRNVYLYDAQQGLETNLLQTYQHRAPVLDVCFGENESVAYSGGLDWDVRRIDLETGEQTVLSSHEMPVKSVAYSPQHGVLISASWDKTLHIHHINQPDLVPATVRLPNKPFAISLSPTKLIVALSDRATIIYDLDILVNTARQSSQPLPNIIDVPPFQQRENSLKFLTRAVAAMPNDEGYAMSSIEGRVSVEWFDDSEKSQARKYAFKCHRQTAPADPEDPDGEQMAIVYPVHALSFHPVHGTFVSGGGDGVIASWDAVSKRRLKQFAKLPAGVAATSYSHDGSLLAIAISSGFEEGREDEVAQGPFTVAIRTMIDGDTASFGSKRKDATAKDD